LTEVFLLLRCVEVVGVPRVVREISLDIRRCSSCDLFGLARVFVASFHLWSFRVAASARPMELWFTAEAITILGSLMRVFKNLRSEFSFPLFHH
jgi:hypothetical protein